MSPVIDCTSESGRGEGVAAAVTAIRSGRLVVLPTDTVYGVGADAFSADAVTRLLEAKGRGRQMPPAVLVAEPRTVEGLAIDVPAYALDLIDAFWPGPLTLILKAQPSLRWDLGDTNGTVGLRMPDDELARAVLAETGPMAVSSANTTGQRPATTITQAAAMLGPAVDVYLDAGPSHGGLASTIVDCTREEPTVLRVGGIATEQVVRTTFRDDG
ncbi:MAG: L-threonylcarbamoyladenylate synthase [Dermatophilaceae bacterium]